MKKIEQLAQKRGEGGTETRAWLNQTFGNVVLLNGKQVAHALGISNQTFRNWIWQKNLLLSQFAWAVQTAAHGGGLTTWPTT